MEKKSLVNKKALVLIISTAVLLVCGFIYFFTDLISADTSKTPTIETTMKVPAGDGAVYYLQAQALKNSLNNFSLTQSNYVWSDTATRVENGLEVKGAWVTKDPNGDNLIEWTSAGKSASEIAAHKVNNEAMYAINQTLATPNKANSLAISGKMVNTIPTTLAGVVGTDVIDNLHFAYFGYKWDATKVITVNNKSVTGAWVNNDQKAWNETTHNPFETTLHSAMNEAKWANEQYKKTPTPANKALAEKNNNALMIALKDPKTDQIRKNEYIEVAKVVVKKVASAVTAGVSDVALDIVKEVVTAIDVNNKGVASDPKNTVEEKGLVDNAIEKVAEVGKVIDAMIDAGKADTAAKAGVAEADARAADKIAAAQAAVGSTNTATTTTATPKVATAENYFSPEIIKYLNENAKLIVDDVLKNGGSCIGSCAKLLATAMQMGNIDNRRIIENYINTIPMDTKAMSFYIGDTTADSVGIEERVNTFAKYVSNIIESNDILKTSYRTSVSMNTATGHMEYVTNIKKKVACGGGAQSDNCFEAIGFIAFDPFSQKYTANIPVQFAGQKISFVSDRNGNVYADLNKLDGKAYLSLGAEGKYFELTSMQVARDGSVGGSFTAFGQLFAYNANTKSFQIPLPLGNLFAGAKNTTLGDAMGSLTIDTRGIISGAVDLSKFTSVKGVAVVDSKGVPIVDKVVVTGVDGKPLLDANGKEQTKDVARTKDITTGSNLGMAFDSKGNLAMTYAYNDSAGNAIGGLSIGTNGSLSGSVNVGQLVGLGNIGVGFDKNGITGASLPIGSVAGVGVSLSIAKDGSMGLGGFVMAGPVPIPLSIGQTAKGGFMLAGPGFRINLGGGDSRPITPPAPKKIAGTENYDMSEVYYAHSLKKLFKTIRIYQVPPMKLTPDQQKARAAKIFAVYKKMLGRNPSTTEFMNWYFYSGHQPYASIGSQTPEQMLVLMEGVMNTTIQGKWYDSVQKEYRFISGEEYQCAKRYSNLSDAFANVCPRPKDIMTSDPFTTATQAPATTGTATNATTNDLSLKAFLDAVVKSSELPAEISSQIKSTTPVPVTTAPTTTVK